MADNFYTKSLSTGIAVRSKEQTDGSQLQAVAIDHGGSVADVKWAEINASASGDNTLVALVAGKKIRVLAVTMVAASAVNAAWKSGAGTTKIAATAVPTASHFDVDRSPPRYFMETAAGEALVLNLSSAVVVRGSLNYVEVA